MTVVTLTAKGSKKIGQYLIWIYCKNILTIGSERLIKIWVDTLTPTVSFGVFYF